MREGIEAMGFTYSTCCHCGGVYQRIYRLVVGSNKYELRHYVNRKKLRLKRNGAVVIRCKDEDIQQIYEAILPQA